LKTLVPKEVGYCHSQYIRFIDIAQSKTIPGQIYEAFLSKITPVYPRFGQYLEQELDG